MGCCRRLGCIQFDDSALRLFFLKLIVVGTQQRRLRRLSRNGATSSGSWLIMPMDDDHDSAGFFHGFNRTFTQHSPVWPSALVAGRFSRSLPSALVWSSTLVELRLRLPEASVWLDFNLHWTLLVAVCRCLRLV